MSSQARSSARSLLSIRGLRLMAPFHAISSWREIARQRRALRRLDQQALADIGLDRQSAEDEAARPAWDAPEHWRRQSGIG